MTDPAPLPPLTDAFFDEVVDGGLTPARLREAVERLEREPDGWKRCALAFLEAQCWRESLRSMEGEFRVLPELVVPTTAPSPPSSRSVAEKWRPIALAAGIAAFAFVLGWGTGPDRLPVEGRAGTSVVNTAASATPVETSAGKDSPARVELASGTMETDDPSPSSPPAIATVGRLRVGEAEDSAAVPIVGGPGLDEQWLRDQPSPITEHQQSLLEQNGYQVDRHRRLVTATLRDGRRLAVPVDRFQVRYTGNGPL